MEHNETKKASQLKFFFYLVPVIGIFSLLAGIADAVWALGFDGLSVGLIGFGVLLFLTLFLKSEVANIKYYLNMTIYSLAVFAICVVGYMFSKNYMQQVDLTKNKMFSLSEQSANVVKRLKQDQVEVVIFTADPRITQMMQTAVVELYNGAGRKIKWTFLDAKKDPLTTQKYGENIRNETILVKAGKKDKRLSLTEVMANPENALTNAVVEVTREKNIKIYFTTGHGEVAYDAPPPARRGEDEDALPSLKAFKDYLGQRALPTAQLNLAQSGFVPEDASLVVLAGPVSDLLPTEEAALEKYLGADGKLLVLLDVPKTSIGASLDNMKGLLKKYGVDAPEKMVLDLGASQNTGSIALPLVSEMNAAHPITHDFGNLMMILSQTRPIVAATDNPAGYKVTELFKSSPQSWSADLAAVRASGGKVSMPAAGQLAPQSMAVAVSQAPPPARPGMPPPPEVKGGMRMVVFGNSDLIQDQFLLRNQFVVRLMMNSINWLTQQEDLIAVPPRQIEGTPIHLTNNELRLIFFLAVLFIPVGLFVGGVSYSMLRRRR